MLQLESQVRGRAHANLVTLTSNRAVARFIKHRMTSLHELIFNARRSRAGQRMCILHCSEGSSVCFCKEDSSSAHRGGRSPAIPRCAIFLLNVLTTKADFERFRRVAGRGLTSIWGLGLVPPWITHCQAVLNAACKFANWA